MNTFKELFTEAKSEIDVDVTIRAPEEKEVRLEGSVEIRTVGESSKRIPIVLRTVRR